MVKRTYKVDSSHLNWVDWSLVVMEDNPGNGQGVEKGDLLDWANAKDRNKRIKKIQDTLSGAR